MNFTHFNHFNSEGNAVMVDVGDKKITTRIAPALLLPKALSKSTAKFSMP